MIASFQHCLSHNTENWFHVVNGYIIYSVYAVYWVYTWQQSDRCVSDTEDTPMMNQQLSLSAVVLFVVPPLTAVGQCWFFAQGNQTLDPDCSWFIGPDEVNTHTSSCLCVCASLHSPSVSLFHSRSIALFTFVIIVSLSVSSSSHLTWFLLLLLLLSLCLSLFLSNLYLLIFTWWLRDVNMACGAERWVSVSDVKVDYSKINIYIINI